MAALWNAVHKRRYLTSRLAPMVESFHFIVLADDIDSAEAIARAHYGVPGEWSFEPAGTNVVCTEVSRKRDTTTVGTAGPR